MEPGEQDSVARAFKRRLGRLRERLFGVAEQPWPPDDRYFFVHINKTAGSSIAEALGIPRRHLTASQYRDIVGPETWAQTFSFAIVRNPWDKVVSHYHYRVKSNQTGLADGSVSFADWVRLAYGNHDPRFYDNPTMFMPQWDWVADEAGTQLVDFIGRFETLGADFITICDRAGLPAVELPHVRSTTRDAFSTYYDDETQAIVARHFAPDISAFGYSFADA